MDLDKKYRDSDGDECNILQMLNREPEWAANVMQELERRNQYLTAEVERLREGIAQEVAWLSDKILTSYCVSSLHNLRALLDKNTDTSE